MNLRTACNHFRHFKLAYVFLFSLLSMLLGLILLSLGFLGLIDVLEVAPSRALMEIGVGLVGLSVAVVGWFHRSFTLLFKIAACDVAFREGSYGDAEARAKEAWQDAKSLRPNDPFYGMALENLTRVARAQGDYDEAESFGRQWVSAIEQAWGSEHRRVIYPIRELAGIYLDIARYAQAKPLLEKALSFWESTSRRDPVSMALCLGSLGRLWQDLDRDDKAEPYLRRAFEMIQSLPERTSHGLTISFFLTVTCLKNGKFDEAESIIEAARKLIEKTFPPESWQFAYYLHNFAHVRCAQKHYAEAEETMRRSLAMMERVWKPDHPRLFSWWASLGDILKFQENWVESENCFRKALQLSEECCAPEHPHIADLLGDYADLLQRLGRTGEAFEHHHHAAQIREFHAPLRIA